jgi:4-diphosphocytidyl-2-C-methyl-D-erythritol kinase
MLTIKAPAKINLTLEVLRKRPDGFHDIRSVFQAIDLSDTLYFERGEGVRFQCDSQGWMAGQSLVSKAAALLQQAVGVKIGAVVKIEKRIPLMSGLGGDSSDAAAVLKGISDLWNLKLPAEKLAEIAAKLGSDAVFFLKGGTALAAGRGEKITPLPPAGQMWVVLVMPDVPVEIGKTGRMYSGLKPAHFTDGSITQKLVEALNGGKPFRPAMLYNVFENIAFEDFTIKRLYLDPMVKSGALHVHLAGSGPTLFTMLPDKARAEELTIKYKSQGMKAFLAATAFPEEKE